MISTFLVDHSAAVPGALLLVAAVCVGVGAVVLRRGPHRLLGWLAGAALLPVAALTLSPTTHRAFEVCAVQFSVPRLGSVELLANVALFVPPVFFAAAATRRPLLVLAAGTGLSAAIEALQAAVPALGRSCDTSDWAMNTAGAVLGALLAAAVSRRWAPGRGPRGDRGGPGPRAAAPGPGGSGSARCPT